MTAFDRFEQEKQKYAERREALDKDFDWTQKQLEKIRALNEVLLKKQEELVSQMNLHVLNAMGLIFCMASKSSGTSNFGRRFWTMKILTIQNFPKPRLGNLKNGNMSPKKVNRGTGR